MAAYRTGLRCLCTLEHKTAVQAHPLLFHIRHKEFSLLEQLRISSEAVSMNLFNLRNLQKRGRYLVKAFLLRGFSERPVNGVMLLILIMLCLVQKMPYIIRNIHRIAYVHGNGAACQVLQMIVENLRVLLFLRSCVAKNRADDI